MSKKNNYVPCVRYPHPLRLGKVEIHEIGYDTKTKEVVLTVLGHAVFKVNQMKIISYLPKEEQ
jgi:hypothetical protein